MKLEAGKYYKTRGGKKAFVSAKNPFDSDVWAGFVDCMRDYAKSWRSNGTIYEGSEGLGSEFDLIEEWKELQRGTCWVVVIDGKPSYVTHESPSVGLGNYTAIAKVEWTEGQGLERKSR